MILKVSVSEFLKTVVRATVPRKIRNWLRSPSRSAEWLGDSARSWSGLTRSIDLLPGIQLRCHPYAYKIYQAAQMDDHDQREEYFSFVSSCRPGMLLFDIGAHFAVFSLTAAKLGGTAVAVDPSPTSCRMIARQAILNQCTENIRIFRAAATDMNGTIGMLSSGSFTPGYFRVEKGRSQRELTQTPAVTVDELSRKFGAPSHVKIDVEGHEAAVLRGASWTLTHFAPILFLELHNDMVRSANENPATILEELDLLRYRTFSTDGNAIDKSSIMRQPIIRIVARAAESHGVLRKFNC